MKRDFPQKVPLGLEGTQEVFIEEFLAGIVQFKLHYMESFRYKKVIFKAFNISYRCKQCANICKEIVSRKHIRN